MFYLHNFVRTKKMCLWESIVSVFIFTQFGKKSKEPFNVMSAWTSTRKSTDKKSHYA